MPEVAYEALAKYGTDLAADAASGRLDPVIGAIIRVPSPCMSIMAIREPSGVVYQDRALAPDRGAFP